MKCNLEWLSAYLDGALAEDKRAKLEEHLKTCEACTAKLEEFVQVEQIAQKIPAPQLSEAYWENFANRVQNKLTIREKQKVSPAWLEALKSFFQPTTGKLAIAGSVAVLILLTFVSLEQWKKQTHRPPVFETEKPMAEGKVDSVQVAAKDESAFRTAEIEKDKKVGLVEGKRQDQPVPERETATLTQKPTKNVPTASAPLGRALAPSAEQKSNEAPILAASAEQDEAKSGDTVIVTAGKKAEIRKEVATSQVKVSAEEIQKLPIQKADDFLKTQVGESKEKGQLHIRGERQPAQEDTLVVTAPQPNTVSIAPYIVKSGAMPAIDTTQAIADFRQIIALREKELKGKLFQREVEGVYVSLAASYVQLYRFSLDRNDWEKANQRLTDFLKANLSDLARKQLLEIRAELKKLKK